MDAQFLTDLPNQKVISFNLTNRIALNCAESAQFC